jgi:AmmeMemoRadiSam system protein B
VQLPFLQFVSKDQIKDLKIVPIMIADTKFEKIGKSIQEAVKELGRKAIIICSSDFTHYGFNYGYVPFDEDVKENMKKLDGEAIKLIEKADSKGFLDYTEKTGATICGKCGISVLLWLMKYKKAELLKYYTSADIIGDYDNAVGYASIVFI